MGALTPSTFEGWELVRGVDFHVVRHSHVSQATPCQQPAGMGEVACVLIVEAYWRVWYEFGGGQEAAAEGV